MKQKGFQSSRQPLGPPKSPNTFHYPQEGQKSTVPLTVASFISSSRKLQPPFSARTKEVQQKGQFISLTHRPNSITKDRFLSLPSQSPLLPQTNMTSKLYGIRIMSETGTAFTEAGSDQEALVCAGYQAGRQVRNLRALALYPEETLRLSFPSCYWESSVHFQSFFFFFLVSGDLHKLTQWYPLQDIPSFSLRNLFLKTSRNIK